MPIRRGVSGEGIGAWGVVMDMPRCYLRAKAHATARMGRIAAGHGAAAKRAMDAWRIT